MLESTIVEVYFQFGAAYQFKVHRVASQRSFIVARIGGFVSATLFQTSRVCKSYL